MNIATLADVSFYQDDDDTPQGIDFDKMKLQSDAVIIRAGQNKWIDPDFKTNWQAAKDAGLMRGSYWFYDSRSEPESQARLWAEALGGDFGELPLCIDLEENYGGAHAGYNKWWGFVKYVKIYIPEKSDHLMIYTGPAYWKEHTGTMPSELNDLFGEMPLWIANYKTDIPKIPSTWDKAMLWQYTAVGDGPLWGVESLGIDLNRFLGDEADAEWFTKDAEIDPPPPDPDPPVEPPNTDPTTFDIRGKFTIVNGWAVSFEPTQDAPDPEPVPEPVWMQLQASEGQEFVKFYRSPDDNEVHKLQLWYWKSDPALLAILPIPPYRQHYKGDDEGGNPIYNLVPNYETEADFLNLSKVWGFAPIQVVRKNNGNFKWLHTDWSEGENWDVNGCYFKLENVIDPVGPPADPAPEEAEIVRGFTATGDDFFHIPFDDPYRQKGWDEPERRLTVPQTFVIFKGNKDVNEFVQLSKEWQWFIYELLIYDSPGQTEEYYLAAYESLVADHRAFTDLHHKDGYTDYVLGLNLEKNDPYYWKRSLTCKGNVVRGYKDGTHLIVEGLDITKPPPLVNEMLYNKRWLIHYTTQITPKVLSNGVAKVVHFPQIKQEINGKMEKTGTSIPFFAPPIPMKYTDVVPLSTGEFAPVVNLERDL